ncbi:hypothetical protein MPER_12688, partial [Moniliophthora perniciosa FA553]
MAPKPASLPPTSGVDESVITIIEHLYPLGETILDAFNSTMESLNKLGKVNASAVGIPIRAKLIKDLDVAWVAFTEPLNEPWYPRLFCELLLTVTPIYSAFCERFPALPFPDNIARCFPSDDLRDEWMLERDYQVFEHLMYTSSLAELLHEYRAAHAPAPSVSSSASTKTTRKRGRSPVGGSESASVAAKKKKDTDSTSVRVSRHHRKPRPTPIPIKDTKGSANLTIKKEKVDVSSAASTPLPQRVLDHPSTKQTIKKRGWVVLKDPEPSDDEIEVTDVPPVDVKGKAKATAPASEDEDSMADTDVYEATRIPAPGTQGRKLSERPEIVERLLTYFGTADKLIEAINSAALIADGSRTLSPLKTFFRAATMLPTPRHGVVVPPCAKCKELGGPCRFEHDPASSVKCEGCRKSGQPCSHNRLWFEWLHESTKDLDLSLSSYAGLLHQGAHLSRDIGLFRSLQDTRSRLDDQIGSLHASILIAQKALRDRVVDPRCILQGLMFMDSSFKATDVQMASLCVAFGWESRDLILDDPKARGFELREALDRSGLFRLFVKGTNIDVTGCKGSSWFINDNDELVSRQTGFVDRVASRIGSQHLLR